ncbi:MAG: CPBP family intramembrane metalloprotease [Lautropia sp.]|nr:CPBP family intramembrane metalloprotease [Lautropia sp.]
MLTFSDLIILAMIFFGQATVGALTSYLALQHTDQSISAELSFDEAANWGGTVTESVLLAIVWAYLRLRCFDFSQLKLSIDRWTIPLTVLLFASAGAASDLYQELHFTVLPHHGVAHADADVPVGGGPAGDSALDDQAMLLSQASLSLVIFSLLNGFFEELFFLGLVFCVNRRHLPIAIAFSLFVRFIFHIYQGWVGALAVTLMGVVFLLFRRRIDSLLPFMLAHAAFDMLGLGVLQLIP